MKTIYLDYAAATPLDPRVLKAMQPYLTEVYANPSSLHTAGRLANQRLEDARGRIAKTLGAKPAEIVFTSGSTEAANLAIQGLAMAHPHARIVTTAIEHEAVLQPTAALEGWGRPSAMVPVSSEGVVDPAQIEAAIDDMTLLVCVQYANNEIGSIQPLAKIAAVIEDARRDRAARGVTMPLYLYCDAAQAGLLNLQVSRLGVDLLSMGGSKLYGPPGSGFLYVRSGVKLMPLLRGGEQESGLRSGTENVAAAVGLATALELIQHDRATETKRLQALRDRLWEEIKRQVPDCELNGVASPRLAGNLNLLVRGASGETLVAYLDKEGIAAATGSACTAANEEPSHVLRALGRTPQEAESSLRLTVGRFTTKPEIEKAAKTLAMVVPRVRQLQ